MDDRPEPRGLMLDRRPAEAPVIADDPQDHESRRLRPADVMTFLAVLASFAINSATPLGSPVGKTNEFAYLGVLRLRSSEQFAVGDWILSGRFGEHAVFNALMTPLVELTSIEVVGWVGRVAAWSAIAWVVVKLGNAIGTPGWATAVSVLLFLGLDQDMYVGGEWIVGGFEAKVVAYPLLLFAVFAAIGGRLAPALVLTGLTASFHPGVGLWGGGSLIVALVVVFGWRAVVRKSPLFLLAAAPGMVTTVASLSTSTLGPDEIDFLTAVMPHHLDPADFGERGPLLLALITVFMVWRLRTDPTRPNVITGVMVGVLAAVFVAGYAASAIGFDPLLALFPFRVFPPVAILLGLLSIGAVAAETLFTRRWTALAILGLVIVVGALVLHDPVSRMAWRIDRVVASWDGLPEQRDLVAAYRIAGESGEPGDVVVSPPFEEPLWYESGLAQYVTPIVPYEELGEWQRRLELLGASESVSRSEWSDAYSAVDECRIAEILEDDRADLMVSQATLDFTEIGRAGAWTVYAIPPIDAAAYDRCHADL